MSTKYTYEEIKKLRDKNGVSCPIRFRALLKKLGQKEYSLRKDFSWPAEYFRLNKLANDLELLKNKPTTRFDLMEMDD